jgi:hypothetical protein
MPVPGGTECKVCGQGLYANVNGSAQCFSCRSGSYQPLTAKQGRDLHVMPITCTPCRAGTYQQYGGSAKCDPAQPGFGTRDSYCQLNSTDKNCVKLPGAGGIQGEVEIGGLTQVACAGGSYNAAFGQHYEPYDSTNQFLACPRCPGNSVSAKANASTFCVRCNLEVDHAFSDTSVPLTNFLGGFLANQMASADQVYCKSCLNIVDFFVNVVKMPFRVIGAFFECLVDIVKYLGTLGVEGEMSFQPVVHALLSPFLDILDPFMASRTRCWCLLGQNDDCIAPEQFVPFATAYNQKNDTNDSPATTGVAIILCVVFFSLLCLGLCSLCGGMTGSCCVKLAETVGTTAKCATTIIKACADILTRMGTKVIEISEKLWEFMLNEGVTAILWLMLLKPYEIASNIIVIIVTLVLIVGVKVVQKVRKGVQKVQKKATDSTSRATTTLFKVLKTNLHWSIISQTFKADATLAQPITSITYAGVCIFATGQVLVVSFVKGSVSVIIIICVMFLLNCVFIDKCQDDNDKTTTTRFLLVLWVFTVISLTLTLFFCFGGWSTTTTVWSLLFSGTLLFPIKYLLGVPNKHDGSAPSSTTTTQAAMTHVASSRMHFRKRRADFLNL